MLCDDFFQRKHSKELMNILHEDTRKLFESDNMAVLFYIFPLIERLVVEILDITSLINVETKNQGTIRTINSMLQDKETKKIFGKELYDNLKKYFADDGLRNQLMHYNPKVNKISANISDIREIKEIAINLAQLYETKLEETDAVLIKKLEKIV
mgnify:CR=1 FL=1